MSFQSIPEILNILQIETLYHQQPLQRLLERWEEVVGEVIFKHTQPISIDRDVLWVATSSAAWAQNLTFERQRLLKKLNKILSISLVDIRFSTARWQRTKKNPSPQQSISSIDHPSYLAQSFNQSPPNNSFSQNPHTVFTNWALSIKTRSQSLPLCPSCDSPTPGGELERWGVCSICAAKSF
jgi:predicted nucleic acid-binding Zn ribbon protein